MPLHPILQAALDSSPAAPLYEALPMDEARLRVRLEYLRNRRHTPVSRVEDVQIPAPGGDIPMRVYSPSGSGPFAVLMFYHGGGFCMLDLDTHDEICRNLCVKTSCVVMSVGYRLAPEHRFPAAPDDCYAALHWAAQHAAPYHGDSTRIGVCGDSAGGCLALVTAMRARDEGGPQLLAQLLLYPVTDYPDKKYASYAEFGRGFGLTGERMRWYWDQYLPSCEMAESPLVAPMKMESMAGLPAAYVVVAEFDAEPSAGGGIQVGCGLRLAASRTCLGSGRYCAMSISSLSRVRISIRKRRTESLSFA